MLASDDVRVVLLEQSPTVWECSLTTHPEAFGNLPGLVQNKFPPQYKV